MPDAVKPRLSTEELMRRAEEERRRKEETDRKRRAASDRIIQRYQAIIGIWLYGSFLVPVFLMMMIGHLLDRLTLGQGPVGFFLTLAAPIGVSMIFVKDIVVDVILVTAMNREMDALYPDGVSLYRRHPARERRSLIIHLWRAGSIIVPLLALWALSGTIDRGLAAWGSARALFLLIPILSWLFVKYVVIGLRLQPKHYAACKSESEAEHAAWLAGIERERAQSAI
jgi:hypothetical protein